MIINLNRYFYLFIYLPILLIFITLFTIILILLHQPEKKPDRYYKTFYIKNNITAPGNFDNSLKHFIDINLQADNFKKTILRDRITSFIKSHSIRIKKIELLTINDKPDIRFTLDTDEILYFANGKILNKTDIQEPEDFTPIIYNYPVGLWQNPPGFYHIPNSSFAFFYKMYGKTLTERNKNLVYIKFINRNLKFNSKNKAAYYLKKVSDQIINLSQNDPEIKKWLYSITSISSYAPRNVAYMDKLSLHSFGIAVDIRTRFEKGNVYWYWSSYYKKEWWDIQFYQKDLMPQKIIDIFELNNFVWGGKWYKYDTMHFEYRPEIINQKYNSKIVKRKM